MRGECKKCKKVTFLTQHSLIGGHIPPFVWLCRECHDKKHGIKRLRFKKSRRGTGGKLQKKKLVKYN